MNKKILLALAAIALLGATAVAILATTSVEAKKDKQVKAKIEWSQKRLDADVNKGETFQTTLTFTPTANLTNAEFRVTASLQDTVTLEPSSFASLTAGTPQQVTVTFTAPAEGKRKKFNGVAALIDANYLYAKPLKLRFGVNK